MDSRLMATAQRLRRIRSPMADGDLLIPAEAEADDDTDAGERSRAMGPGRTEYGKWPAFSEKGEHPRLHSL